jgi:hypothetical protein
LNLSRRLPATTATGHEVHAAAASLVVHKQRRQGTCGLGQAVWIIRKVVPVPVICCWDCHKRQGADVKGRERRRDDENQEQRNSEASHRLSNIVLFFFFPALPKSVSQHTIAIMSIAWKVHTNDFPSQQSHKQVEPHNREQRAKRSRL